ncbi:Y-family DNA polymerase [Oryzibacter oryziterrae]|uniref:Y-family DNA polymerase n=1 Tax=Oryzibacter oryziterrae TaxID=2766474 RepID=UPI001F360E4B|nr:DNA polymerase Y family protein [Oryzibacter oryziterrae]
MVLTSRERGAVRLLHVDAAARAAGLQPGLGLADARASCPQIDAREADTEADAMLLAALCDWVQRYTPLAGIHGDLEQNINKPNSEPPEYALVLDITGCAHLFDGEEGLASDLAHRLERQGFTLRIGIASTIGAAYARARYGRGGLIGRGEERDALVGLPLAALRLDAQTVDGLARTGLKRIGDIIDAPRAPLTARFGPMPFVRLDQALGRAGESFSPRLPVAPFRAERRFFEPVIRQEDIRTVAMSLLRHLAQALEEAGSGALRLCLSLFRVDGAVRHVEAGLSWPSREAEAMHDILCRRLDALDGDIDAGFGFDCIAIAIVEVVRRDAESLSLDGHDPVQELSRFVDRVGARIGQGRITCLMPQASHIPERAAVLIPMQASPADPVAWPQDTRESGDPPERPVRLLTRPEPIETMASVPDGPPIRFRWRRMDHAVRRAEGPERIAAEWWQAEGPTRDYFRVEDSEGRRFWMFREGLYGRETLHPHWYMHGLFA